MTKLVARKQGEILKGNYKDLRVTLLCHSD